MEPEVVRHQAPDTQLYTDPGAKRRDGSQPYYPHGTGPFVLNRREKRQRWFGLSVAVRNALIRRHGG